MKEILPVITMFMSGVFGLIVAVTTWYLTTLREKRNKNLDNKLREYKEKEDLYLNMLASIDKAIRFTKLGKDYAELIDSMTMQSARLNIFGSKVITNISVEVSDKLYEWSTNYRKGMPKKSGVMNLSIISTEDQQYIDKANELYPELVELIQKLASEVKKELMQLKKDIS